MANLNDQFRISTGSLGEWSVICTTRSGLKLISHKPMYDDNHHLLRPQDTHSRAFREAATYAVFAQSETFYGYKVLGAPFNAYEVALADFLGTPQVLAIDISAWTGGSGQSILVKAKDNVMVVSLYIMIRDDSSGAILEAGEALQSDEDGLSWTYITRNDVPQTPGISVYVFARDLPGNVGTNRLKLS